MNNSEDLRAYPKNSGNSVNIPHIFEPTMRQSKEITMTKYEQRI